MSNEDDESKPQTEEDELEDNEEYGETSRYAIYPELFQKQLSLYNTLRSDRSSIIQSIESVPRDGRYVVVADDELVMVAQYSENFIVDNRGNLIPAWINRAFLQVWADGGNQGPSYWWPLAHFYLPEDMYLQ